MKILKTALIVALSFSAFEAMSQSESDYIALTEFLTAEQITEMQANQPLQYERLAYVNRHGYHISQFGLKETENFPNAFEVAKRYESLPEITLELIESQTLNLAGYQFELSMDKYHYYKLDDNGTVLSIAPLEILFRNANLEIE